MPTPFVCYKVLADQSPEFDHFAASEREALQWVEENAGMYFNRQTGLRFRVLPKCDQFFDLYTKLTGVSMLRGLSDDDANTVRQAAKAVLELHELTKKIRTGIPARYNKLLLAG